MVAPAHRARPPTCPKPPNLQGLKPRRPGDQPRGGHITPQAPDAKDIPDFSPPSPSTRSPLSILPSVRLHPIPSHGDPWGTRGKERVTQPPDLPFPLPWALGGRAEWLCVPVANWHSVKRQIKHGSGPPAGPGAGAASPPAALQGSCKTGFPEPPPQLLDHTAQPGESPPTGHCQGNASQQ